MSLILINTSSSFNLDEDDFLDGDDKQGDGSLYYSFDNFFKFYKRICFNISIPSNYMIF